MGVGFWVYGVGLKVLGVRCRAWHFPKWGYDLGGPYNKNVFWGPYWGPLFWETTV